MKQDQAPNAADRGSELTEQLDATRLRRSAMGGRPGEYHDTAFTDPDVAAMRAAEMAGEWVSYHPETVRAERMPGGRCAIDGRLYALDATSLDDALRARAIAKLTAAERGALGV